MIIIANTTYHWHCQLYSWLQERHSSGSLSSRLLAGSTSTFNQSPSALAAQHPPAAAIIGEVYEPYQSPGAVEVSSDAVVRNNGIDHLDRIAGTPEISSSSELEVGQALRRLEEQLSLNDDSFEEIKNENSNDLDLMLNYQCRYVPFPDDEIDLVLQQETGMWHMVLSIVKMHLFAHVLRSCIRYVSSYLIYLLCCWIWFHIS